MRGGRDVLSSSEMSMISLCADSSASRVEATLCAASVMLLPLLLALKLALLALLALPDEATDRLRVTLDSKGARVVLLRALPAAHCEGCGDQPPRSALRRSGFISKLHVRLSRCGKHDDRRCCVSRVMKTMLGVCWSWNAVGKRGRTVFGRSWRLEVVLGLMSVKALRLWPTTFPFCTPRGCCWLTCTGQVGRVSLAHSMLLECAECPVRCGKMDEKYGLNASRGLGATA